MSTLKIKNWTKFQHYKDRNPPWIKLHFEILSSSDWVMLDDASKLLAVVCMLIASKTDNQIDSSEKGLAYIQRVAYLNKKPNLKPLVECGFLEFESGCKQMLANDNLSVSVSASKENKGGVGEKGENGFDTFWSKYPSKVGKPVAMKAYEKAVKKTTVEAILDGLERYKTTKPDWKAWCNPATWLNQERWTDEPTQEKQPRRNEPKSFPALREFARKRGFTSENGNVVSGDSRNLIGLPEAGSE